MESQFKEPNMGCTLLAVAAFVVGVFVPAPYDARVQSRVKQAWTFVKGLFADKA